MNLGCARGFVADRFFGGTVPSGPIIRAARVLTPPVTVVKARPRLRKGIMGYGSRRQRCRQCHSGYGIVESSFKTWTPSPRSHVNGAVAAARKFRWSIHWAPRPGCDLGRLNKFIVEVSVARYVSGEIRRRIGNVARAPQVRLCPHWSFWELVGQLGLIGLFVRVEYSLRLFSRRPDTSAVGRGSRRRWTLWPKSTLR